MSELNEAPISASTKVKSPNGFEYILTLREGATELLFNALMTLITDKEKTLLSKGWTPLAQQKPGYPPKVIEYVKDRLCPTDGAKLVYALKKDGSKYVKCENNKWDRLNSRSTGCPFVEWPDKPKEDKPEVDIDDINF